MLHFIENAASERTVNVAEELSMYEDNDQNNFGSRKEQGGSVEEKNRNPLIWLLLLGLGGGLAGAAWYLRKKDEKDQNRE